MSETIKQGLIRAVITAVLAGLGFLVPWLTQSDVQEALGSFAIYTPIIIGILSGIVKALGGATEPAEVGRGRTAGGPAVKRPNIFAI